MTEGARPAKTPTADGRVLLVEVEVLLVEVPHTGGVANTLPSRTRTPKTEADLVYIVGSKISKEVERSR